MLSTTSSAAAGGGLAVVVAIYLVIIVLFVVGWVKILAKAGYSGWWVLLGFVPLVNLIAFFAFAFGDWPVLRAARQGGYPGGYPTGGGYVPQGYPPPAGGYPPPGYPPTGGYPPPPPGPDDPSATPQTTPWPG